MGFFSWLTESHETNLSNAEFQLQQHKEALAKAKVNLRNAKLRKDSSATSYQAQVDNHQYAITRLKEEIKR